MALKVSFRGRVVDISDAAAEIPLQTSPPQFVWIWSDQPDHRTHAFDQWVFGVNPVALCGATRDSLDEDNEAERCCECLHRAARRLIES